MSVLGVGSYPKFKRNLTSFTLGNVGRSLSPFGPSGSNTTHIAHLGLFALQLLCMNVAGSLSEEVEPPRALRGQNQFNYSMQGPEAANPA